MALGDIQEQIDLFMQKMQNTKVPKKASGEAIVSKKPEKVKPEKKGSLTPTFKDIGISGFQVIDKNAGAYGSIVKVTKLVGEYVILKYASEMSPSLQLMALVFADTKWAAKFKAINDKGENIPLFQACVKLGIKLDEWGQSEDWVKIKSHMPDNKEALIEAENAIAKAIQADQEPVLEPKNTSDEAIVAYLQELPDGMSYPDQLEAVLKKFPLLHPSSPLTALIFQHNVDQAVIAKAIADGEPWAVEDEGIYSGPIKVPGENKWVKSSMTIIEPILLQAVQILCVEGKSSSADVLVFVDDAIVINQPMKNIVEGKKYNYATGSPIVLTGKNLTIRFKSKQPITVNSKFIYTPLTPLSQIINVSKKIKEEDSGEIPFSAEENKAYYSTFLEQLVNLTTVLDETIGGPTPDQPVVLLKHKGEWVATVMEKEGVDVHALMEEEPKALPPGPEEEKKPGNLILTQPAKIRSPGGNEQASPPTFISLPTGKVTITKFIWTLPSEVHDDTECTVLVGYGAEQYILKGTFKSAGEAPPFPIEKGGVLKVTLITTQPMEAWLELELELEIQPTGFLMKLGTVLTPASLPLLTVPPIEKSEKPETQEQELKPLLAEVIDAQVTLLADYQKLEELLIATYGAKAVQEVQSSIEEQSQGLALAAEKKIAAEKELLEEITQCGGKEEVVKPFIEELVYTTSGFNPIPEGGTAQVGLLKGKPKKEKPKGYQPKITAVNVNGKAVDVKELADALRSHLKGAGFTHYTIEGFDHEYKKTKGVLMNKKITWAGDPEANLIKWAAGIQGWKGAMTIEIHFKTFDPISLLDCIWQLAHNIKPKK